MAKKNSGPGMFDALTLRQTERLMDRLDRAAESLPDTEAGNWTAIEIYDVLNHDLHPAWEEKFDQASKTRRSGR